MLKDLILKNRSYRRFNEEIPVPGSDLLDMIDAARLSASARNAQPLKYFLSNDTTMNREIFPTLAWAGYLKDWPGPGPGERPAAYIVQLLDTTISPSPSGDDGIAAQSILLTAVEKGLGGCIIGSVKKERLSAILHLPDQLQILHVIALGVPVEEIIIEEIANDDIKYWRDDLGRHHVPKRNLDDLIVNKAFRESE